MYLVGFYFLLLRSLKPTFRLRLFNEFFLCILRSPVHRLNSSAILHSLPWRLSRSECRPVFRELSQPPFEKQHPRSGTSFTNTSLFYLYRPFYLLCYMTIPKILCTLKTVYCLKCVGKIGYPGLKKASVDSTSQSDRCGVDRSPTR